MRARGVLAAALLLGAAARLALPPDAASAAEGRRSGAGTEPLRGVIARSELCLPLPEGARISRSVKGAGCGEVCAESFTHSVDGKPLCRDCYKPYTRFDV